MASKLAQLEGEEAKLLEIKEKLNDQLRRLQVEELALRSMLQPDNALTEAKVVDVNSITSEPVLMELQKRNSSEAKVVDVNDITSEPVLMELQNTNLISAVADVCPTNGVSPKDTN